jgi:hypothetical protein
MSDVKPAFPSTFAVVLIDHRHARFFEAADGTRRLEERGQLEPKDPHGFLRHLEHRKEADYKGQRTPEADEFYERVAQRLKTAAPIVLIGEGTGTSSALVHLRGYLKEKHKEIDEHVVGAERADLSHIDLGEIEQIARRYA